MGYATISNGNTKLGSIPSLSLPPMLTCEKGLPCYRDCYARQAYNQYPLTEAAYDRNVLNAYNNPDRFFRSVAWWLRTNKPTMFRWHSSGDIPAVWYLDGMVTLAKQFPDVRFLCFTKRYKFVARRRFPKNLSVVLSVWPGMKLPRTTRPLCFVDDGRENRIKNAIPCSGGCDSCGMCWYLPELNRNVVIKLHGVASIRKDRSLPVLQSS